MQKKIIYIGKEFGNENTAMSIHCVNMCKLFTQIGYKVTVICGTDNNKVDNHLDDRYHYVGWKQFDGKIGTFFSRLDDAFGFSLFAELKKMAKDSKPDIIVLYGYSGQKKMQRYCRKNNIPFIVERVDWFERSDYQGVFDKYVKNYMVEHSYKKLDLLSDGVIAISQYIEDYFVENNMHCINIPPLFENKPENQEYLYNVCSHPLKIVYAGSVGGGKDILFPFIDAVKVINSEMIKVSLTIIGPNKSILKNKYGDIELADTGIEIKDKCKNDEVLHILKESDFSILLRYNKRYAKAGFSTKFAESMFMGTPVICTNIGGADSCITDMKNGVLIADNSVESIIMTLKKLLMLNDREICEIKRNAYEYAKDNFSIESHCSELEEYFNNLVRSKQNYSSEIMTL